MKSFLTRTGRVSAVATLALAGVVALAFASTEGGGQPEQAAPTKTLAELAFANAPYGVDPIVTGPSSASLEARQRQAGCDGQVWPNIDVACYPD